MLNYGLNFLIAVAGIFSIVESCDDGSISFDGNLEKCATQPSFYRGDFDCAFFVHDNCGGRRLGICGENPDFSQQNFHHDASAVVVRSGCIATACHGKDFTNECTEYGPGYHNFWFAKQLMNGNIDEGIHEAHGFNDRVQSAKCVCETTTTTSSTTTSKSILKILEVKNSQTTAKPTTTMSETLQTIEILNKNETDGKWMENFSYIFDTLRSVKGHVKLPKVDPEF